MSISKSLAAAALLSLAITSAGKAASKDPTLRQEAEHLCYDDVMRLCPDQVPDEDQVQACMTAKRKQLSPDCARVFNEGVK